MRRRQGSSICPRATTAGRGPRPCPCAAAAGDSALLGSRAAAGREHAPTQAPQPPRGELALTHAPPPPPPGGELTLARALPPLTGEDARGKKRRERWALTGGSEGQNYLFHPHLTAHGNLDEMTLRG